MFIAPSTLAVALLASWAPFSAPPALAWAAASPSPNAQTEAAPAAAGPSIERFLRIRTPGAATIAPDGTLYVRDWPDGVFQLFRVEESSAKPGAKTTQLTSFADGLSGYSLSPDGTLILLMYAAGGNENTQVSLLDPRADGGRGRIVPLLRNPRVRHDSVRWLDGSRGFLYTANDESPNDFHVYRFDLAEDPFTATGSPGASTKLLARPGSWAPTEEWGGGARVLIENFRSASDTSLHELDVATKALSDLTPKSAVEGGTVAIQAVGYMPGGGSVLYVADTEDGIPRLFQRDLTSGAITKPIPALDPFEIEGTTMNRERTLLAVNTNEDGYGVPHLYRLPGFEEVTLPTFEPGVNFISMLRGNRAIASVNNARTPGLAFSFDVPSAAAAAADGEAQPAPPALRQITFADDQGIDLAGFPLPRLVKYTSFDGMEIPAFLYVPPGYKGDRPLPFIVNYHGGPEGQSRPMFNNLLQYLLANGFGVMLPNVRGSSGYGRAFLMADDYTKRWDSVRDGVEAAAWLVSNGLARPGQIATYGGSYGGYMSMACLVEDMQRVQRGEQKEPLFGAGVNVVGLVNLKTFLEKTAGYRRKLREQEYGPLSDPEFLASVSPMTHIDLVKVPVFIAHGFNDPRVPVEEAMQLAVALKDRGHSPQVFIAPDEGHGFAKLVNRLYFGERMAAFLKGTIGGEAPAAAPVTRE
jgi:dipeptidyl aminopeptidase/acylaminoacyl peptidase